MSEAAATIVETAIAVPAHPLPQDAVKRVLPRVMPMARDRMDAVMAIFDGTRVEHRWSALPLDEIGRARPLTETMELYRTEAIRLGRRVASDCLERARVAATEIDLIITVSCTGVIIPSLDAYLANDLGLRSDIRRLPITELGCHAGAAAMIHARDFILGHPEANVLVVSVELPTLSFQGGDPSLANLVSTAIFGDGAAAVLVTGRDAPGARILGTQSHLFPRTIDALGFDLKDDGFHVVLARELPSIVRSELGGLVDRLTARSGLTRQDLSSLVLHPGGRRILETVEDTLALPPEAARVSWEIMRDYGNLSSATVLFVLDEWLQRRRPPAGAHGLMGAFGPGFSTELLLLEWT